MLRLERTFDVPVSRERAWDHLARVASWPTWARHIRSIRLEPEGPLTAETSGVIRLTNGIRSSFRMDDLSPPDRWLWSGGFLWMTVHYDHAFEATGPNASRLRFVVDVKGFGARAIGRLFRAIYARNLDKAILNLIQELANL